MNRIHIKFVALAVTCFALFMVNLDNTAVMVLPKIQTSLDFNLLGLQWILNTYTLAAASSVLISGILGNIYGRKRALLTGLTIFMMASLACGLSPSLGILMAGRILQGIGAAALIPASLFILADSFPKPKAVVIWCGVSVVGLITGSVLGQLLVDTLGWRSLFFLNVPLGAIAVWVTSLFVKEVSSPKQRLHVSDLALNIALFTALTYTYAKGSAGTWQSPLTLWLLTVNGLSLLTFLGFESRSICRMLSLRLLSNPRFATVNFVSVLVFFTVVSLPVVFNLFSQQAQGYSTTNNYPNLHPNQPKELNDPKLTSQEKTHIIASSQLSKEDAQSAFIVSLYTPASDLGRSADANIQGIFARAGNDTIYGYDPGKDSHKSQKIDILFGDLFDNSVQEYRDILEIQAGYPLPILSQKPPVAGIDRFILGDANQPYYTDNSGNPKALLTTNFLGLNEFAVLYDFNPFEPNQDIIRLNGTKQDYVLVDANGIPIPGYQQLFYGKAIFSLQQGLPDLVAYVIENPKVKLDLNAKYFEFVGEKPNTMPQLKWVDQLATTGFDFSYDAAADLANNVYITGSTSGPLEGPPQGSDDIWVAKYDNKGKKLFGKQFGTPSSDQANAVATDRDGNFYLAGSTSGSLYSSKQSASDDAWVAKFDSDGNLLWGRQFGNNVTGGFSNPAFGLKVDQSGNVYLSGLAVKKNTRTDLFSFAVQDDSWIIKFDRNGNQQWYTEIRDANAPFPFNLAPFFDENYDLALDQDGNSYLVGWTQGLVKEADPVRPNLLKYDFWTAKVDTNGKLQWIQQVGSKNQGLEFGWAIAVDSQGNVYPMGWTTGNLGTQNQQAVELTCKNQQIPALTCLYSPWLAKFDSNGNLKFIREFNSNGDSGTYTSGMKIDAQDNIFIMGYTNTKLGQGPVNPAYNAWLARFDTNGNNIWVQQFGAKNRLTYPTGVAVDNANRLAVTGYTDGYLGTNRAGADGAVDAWLAQFNAQNGNLTNFMGRGGSVDSIQNPGPIRTVDASHNLVTADQLPDSNDFINFAARADLNADVVDYGQIVSNLGRLFDSNADNSFPQAFAQAVRKGTIVVPKAQK